MIKHILKQSDCLLSLKEEMDETFDLIYLDPPFFTQREHSLNSRVGDKNYRFLDSWKSNEEYALFMHERVKAMHRVLKSTGSIFVHCDNNASHIIRFILDDIFGVKNFRSKIIWTYKRWTNSKKGLTSAYQEIFFYSKTNNYKFNKIYTEYSATTNLDQILQKRCRDERNKSVYAKSGNEVITGGDKRGVPLNDVWNIPFLNPKASERVGYPTQKPLLLIEKILQLSTDKGDIVLDPFCGSGTTIVAAKLLERSGIGIDISKEAIELSEKRLLNPIKSESALLSKGAESYVNKDNPIFEYFPKNQIHPVQRNKGIDGLFRLENSDSPILIRIQRPYENLNTAAEKLFQASKAKGKCMRILVRTQQYNEKIDNALLKNLTIVDSMELQLIKKCGDFIEKTETV